MLITPQRAPPPTYRLLVQAAWDLNPYYYQQLLSTLQLYYIIIFLIFQLIFYVQIFFIS